jgi:hypothetical protein
MTQFLPSGDLATSSVCPSGFIPVGLSTAQTIPSITSQCFASFKDLLNHTFVTGTAEESKHPKKEDKKFDHSTMRANLYHITGLSIMWVKGPMRDAKLEINSMKIQFSRLRCLWRMICLLRCYWIAFLRRVDLDI